MRHGEGELLLLNRSVPVLARSLSIMLMYLWTYLRVGLTDGLACDDSVVTP